MKSVFLATVVLVASCMFAVEALVEPYGSNICRLLADGVKVRNPGQCDSYITCNGGVGVVSKCGSGKYYNKETQKCVSKVPDDYCKGPCTKKSPFWEADPKSCNGYFKCDGISTGVQEYCPNDLDFDFKSQSCVYKSDSNCFGFDVCNIIPNNVPFKDEANCQLYYTCVKNKIQTNVCQKSYYDVQKGCAKKSEVYCASHPTPWNICGTPKRPVRDKFVSDERTCNGYYFCHDVGDNVVDDIPTMGRCPQGKFFDGLLQACNVPENVKCDDDRCAGMSQAKVLSSDLGCQNYLICENGQTVRKEKCPNGMFFNVNSSECTGTVQSYPACS